jgi:hypothetical protein
VNTRVGALVTARFWIATRRVPVIHAMMGRDQAMATPPVLFTKEYTIRFRNPTQLGPVRVTTTVSDLRQRSASVEATVESGGRVCVEFAGIFVLPIGPL